MVKLYKEKCSDKSPTLFALQHKTTGKLATLTYEATAYNDFSAEVAFSLSEYGEHIFIKSSKKGMEDYLTCAKDILWYNTSIETPMLESGFVLEDYKIVELEIK